MVHACQTKAPEILNESPDVDLVLADVYSFGIHQLPPWSLFNHIFLYIYTFVKQIKGIILWELLTRKQPYLGMRYLQLSYDVYMRLLCDIHICIHICSPAAVAVAVIRDNLRPEVPGINHLTRFLFKI